jgi:oxalate decarboxylase/phosphoglucose isomerase-like protein (cupin superfamily)
MAKRVELKVLTEPTLVRRADVPYTLWGDDEAGYVNDLFYVLSAQMMLLAVTLPPGGRWRSSDKCRAFYDTHECVYVVNGQFTCQDPETGEVRTVKAGEMLSMAEKRWHYGYNFGSEDLHMLEFIAPPAAQGAVGDVPRPRELIGWDAAALKNWPRVNTRGADNLRVCRLAEAVDTVIGDANPVLCRVLSCTDKVFLGVITIPPRSRSVDMTFPYDICYHGDGGEITLHVSQRGTYFAIHKSDVAFVPTGISHRLFNHTGETLQILIGGAGNFSRLTTGLT